MGAELGNQGRALGSLQTSHVLCQSLCVVYCYFGFCHFVLSFKPCEMRVRDSTARAIVLDTKNGAQQLQTHGRKRLLPPGKDTLPKAHHSFSQPTLAAWPAAVHEDLSVDIGNGSPLFARQHCYWSCCHD